MRCPLASTVFSNLVLLELGVVKVGFQPRWSMALCKHIKFLDIWISNLSFRVMIASGFYFYIGISVLILIDEENI
jgi:hypothetical protein